MSVKGTFDHEILGPILEDFPEISKTEDFNLILAMRLIYEANMAT